jgi:murein L,D-transpeptidase YafK
MEDEAVLKQIDRYHLKLDEALAEEFAELGLTWPPVDLFIRVFKHEHELEIWVRAAGEQRFRLFRTRPIARLPFADLAETPPSELGPKRRQGDGKVPEGVYRLLYHNPWSQFHLSLAVGYPNAADAIRGRRAGVIDEKGEQRVLDWWRRNRAEVGARLQSGQPGIWNGPARPLGNLIFIHGGSATIGCIPISDDPIEELFLLSDPRLVGGTWVHIFPCRLDRPENQPLLQRVAAAAPELAAFWESLRPIQAAFDTSRTVPEVAVRRSDGMYVLVGGEGAGEGEQTVPL